MSSKEQVKPTQMLSGGEKKGHLPDWQEFCDTAYGEIDFRMCKDYMFLVIMQRSERVRKSFVSALLDVPEESVISCELLERSRKGKYVQDKSIIFDVLVLVNKNRKVNIEMQIDHMTNWEKRSLFYICREYIEDLKEGEDYNTLLPVVHTAVLTERVPGGEKTFLSKYNLTNQKTGKVYSDKLEIRLVNLKYIKEASEAEKSRPIYRWALLLAAKRWEEITVNAERIPQMDSLEEAAMLLRKLQSDPEVRALARAQERYDHDMATMKAEGKAEGRAEGKAEGRAVGQAQGKAEAVLELLEVKYGQVTDALRQQVMKEQDIQILSSWIKLAVHVSSIREFEEKAGLLAK